MINVNIYEKMVKMLSNIMMKLWEVSILGGDIGVTVVVM